MLARGLRLLDIPQIGHETFDAFVAFSPLVVALPPARDVGLGRVYVFRALEGAVTFRLAGTDTIDGLTQIPGGQARTLLSDGNNMWIQIADHG